MKITAKLSTVFMKVENWLIAALIPTVVNKEIIDRNLTYSHCDDVPNSIVICFSLLILEWHQKQISPYTPMLTDVPDSIAILSIEVHIYCLQIV